MWNVWFFFCSPRTSTLSCTASGMATAWTTMKRKGRRKVVRLTSGPTKPGSWLVWRLNCTTNRDMQRRFRWRRRKYKGIKTGLAINSACLFFWFRKTKNEIGSNKHSKNSGLCFYSIKMHEQRKTKQKNDDKTPEGAVPAYLLDREGQSRAKVLSNMIKQKRKEKAVSAHWNLLVTRSFLWWWLVA